MADFMNKAAAGTSRMNPSSMVPGSTGNAPQGGLGTQAAKRAPRRVMIPNEVQGSGGGAPYNALADQLMQAPSTGVIPQSLQNMVYAPVNSTYPGGTYDPSAKPRSLTRVSSAKNGPTPVKHIPTGNWWDNPPGMAPEEPDPSGTMLGPWALSNGPVRSQQSDLPVEQQRMLPEEKKSRALKSEDFDLLASVFKALATK